MSCQPSNAKNPTAREPCVGSSVERIRQAIADIDFVCSGTLSTRWKVCGKPNCRCAADPGKRHGPYHEWSRRLNGRLRHSVISEEQAAGVALAIKNHDRILALLKRWEAETTRSLRIETDTK